MAQKHRASKQRIMKIFLQLLSVFDYSDGILRCRNGRKFRVTVNYVLKTLHVTYYEYYQLLKVLEPFNVIEEVYSCGKRYIRIDESVVLCLFESIEFRHHLAQQELDKNSMQ